MKKSLWLVLIIVLSVAAIALGGCGEAKLGAEDNPIVMSFVPSGDTQEIIASGDQIAEAVSDATGLVIVANVGADYAAVRESMGAGKAHIGWLNTFNYMSANEEYGVDVGLVTERNGSTSYRGQLNVRADSGITSLEDLKGKAMCWVDPMTASGYIVPRITLQANRIDPDADFARTVEAGSHENVITEVYRGNCDVGATYADARTAVEGELPDVMEQVAVLATTPNIPNDSISFINDFPEDLREQIVNALLEYAATGDGQAALEAFYSVSGLQRAENSIYAEFRADLSNAGIDPKELSK